MLGCFALQIGFRLQALAGRTSALSQRAPSVPRLEVESSVLPYSICRGRLRARVGVRPRAPVNTTCAAARAGARRVASLVRQAATPSRLQRRAAASWHVAGRRRTATRRVRRWWWRLLLDRSQRTSSCLD
jgi:hypothetical protein